MQLIGWVAAILLAFCAIPAAIDAYRRKACYMNKLFLHTWLWGEVAGTIYVTAQLDWPLMFNYWLNLICTAILVYYRRDYDSK